MEISVAKKVCGVRAANMVEDGMVVGLGSGSTIVPMVMELSSRVKNEGLEVIGIPTSEATASLASQQGIKLSSLDEHPVIDMVIDGADEISPQLDLIKGLGGALVREKIVACASRRMVVVADDGKLVETLGRGLLPVEVVPFAWQATKDRVKTLGCKATLRKKETIYVTDNGNYILDCSFGPIDSPSELEMRLNNIPGVVENGLFLGMAKAVVVGYDNGETKLIQKD